MSTPPLFLVDALPDADAFELGGDEGRHAAKVRRLRAGERLSVSDGRGGVLDCEVAELRPDGLWLTAHERRTVAAPSPRIVVAQALVKGERGELAVEVMTELGVDEIVPWQASRSIVQWHGPRGERALERWRSTAREASKQSRRAWLPTVSAPEPTVAIARLVTRCAGALVLHEAAGDSLATVALPETGDLLLVIGPEGGVAPDELDALEASGARAVRMGDPVLRTSTAGAAALAALSLRLGRWA